MRKTEEMVKELRKRGLSNGGNLGYHSGLMDEAADLIEELQKEIKKRKTETAKDILDKVEAILDRNLTWDTIGLLYRADKINEQFAELRKEYEGEKEK